MFELEPNYYPACCKRGESKLKLQNYREALEDFNEYIKYSNPDKQIYYYRGFCEYKLKDYNNAVKDFNMSDNNIKTFLLKTISKLKLLFVKK
ncbi:hypothetical protein R4Q14_06255 [Brachyspira intermedia]|uniref:hypothetical protein n=1 Tax=Brachyspira intermedia TaxID=84377 RepID=UPI0030074D8D